MSWVRLEDNFIEHPKVLALSATALRVWLRAICHCNQHGTGGFVSDRILTRIGCTPKVRLELVTAPTGYTSGLLEPAIGGLLVHDYAEYQTRYDGDRAESGRQGGLKSGETRRRKRQESLASHEADPIEANEARARVPVPSRPVPSQDPPKPPEADDEIPSSESPSETRLKTDTFGDHEIGSAWAAGVTEGAGMTMSVPRGGELVALVALAAAHGPPREGMHGSRNVAAWARERGKAYGVASRGQVRNVFRFKDFVNAPDAPVGGTSTRRADPTPPPYHGPVKSAAPVDLDPVAPPPTGSPFAKAKGGA